MEKNYYKAYYQLERSHWWFLARGEMLIDHLKSATKGKKDLKILNVGTATGRTSELLAQLGAVVSLEYDQDCVDFVRQNVGIDVIQGSILELPFETGQFDIVCAFDVVEHVDDHQTAVAELFRVAKTGGLVSVTVPAFQFLWSQHDVVNHHFRRYTRANLREVFQKTENGRAEYETYFNFWLFFPIAAVRILSKLLPERKVAATNETASDFEMMKSNTINQIFYRIFKSENFFLKRRISLPVGVSVLSSWIKQ